MSVQLRSSEQWSQIDRMGAGYYVTFLALWIAHQIWGWSTYFACLWGSQFYQLCDYQWFQICQCNCASSSWLATWWWFLEHGLIGTCHLPLSFCHCWSSWEHQPGHSYTIMAALKDGRKSSSCIFNSMFHLPMQERQEMGFDPWVGKIPWRRRWQPAQYSCLWNSMNRGV